MSDNQGFMEGNKLPNIVKKLEDKNEPMDVDDEEEYAKQHKDVKPHEHDEDPEEADSHTDEEKNKVEEVLNEQSESSSSEDDDEASEFEKMRKMYLSISHPGELDAFHHNIHIMAEKERNKQPPVDAVEEINLDWYACADDTQDSNTSQDE